MSEFGEFLDVFGDDDYLNARARFIGELPILYVNNRAIIRPVLEADCTVADVYDYGYRVQFDCLPGRAFYATECDGLWKRL